MSRRVRNLVLAGLAALALWVVAGRVQVSSSDGPRFGVLRGTTVRSFFTPSDAARAPASAKALGYSFEVDATGLYFIAGNSLIEFQKRGAWNAPVAAVRLSAALANDEIVADRGGAILVRSGNRLSQLEGAKLAELATLPGEELHLAGSRQNGILYAYGRLGDESGGIVVFSDAAASERLYARLYDVPVALCEALDGIYVALADNRIYQLLGTNRRLVFAVPKVGPRAGIDSLAVTDDGRVLFYSTRDAVYAIAGNAAVRVTQDLGGRIKWFDGRLFVFDRARRRVVAIQGIEAALGVRN